MPSDKVDSIILEIETTSDKADGGIDKVIKNLASMQKVAEGLDVSKFSAIRDCLKDFSNVGEQLKNAGNGLKGIASSVKSLSGIETTKLKDISDAVSKIGNSLGNLGSNNKISIKIDSEGIKKSIKPLEDVQSIVNGSNGTQPDIQIGDKIKESMDSAAQAIERLVKSENNATTAGNSLAGAQQSVSNALKSVNTQEASTKMQALVLQIKQYKDTVNGMEKGKQIFDVEEYENAVNGLRRAQEEFQNFKDKVSNSPQNLDDIARSISSIGDVAKNCGLDTFSSVLQGVAAVLPSIEMGGMAANAGFQSMATGLQAVQAAIPVIGLILTLISALVNAVNAASDKIKNAVGKIASSFKSMVTRVRQSISQMIAKMSEFSKKIKSFLGIQDKSFSELQKKLKALTRLFTFMLLRKMFTQLFMGAQAGFDNLAKFSNYYGTEFNKSVSLIYNSLKQLGNAFATAFEPIFNFAAPALDFLIGKLIAASNALAQFFSALTGKSTWTKAIKLNDNYAKSLEGAANAAKNLTTGIDELHILQENSSGGAGTGAENAFTTESIGEKYKNLADMFKKAWENADFYDIGKMLGDKLAEALANIPWDKIRENARKIGKSLATFINGFIEGEFDGKSVSWWIGNTIAQAINTAFDFINSFAKNLNWSGVGQAFMDGLRGICENLDWDNAIRPAIYNMAIGLTNMVNTIFGDTETWGLVGNTIAKGFNTALNAALLVVDNFKFDSFGTSIGKLLGNSVNGIEFSKLAHTISTGINGVFRSLYNFSVEFPWVEIALKIAKSINDSFSRIDWPGVFAGVGAFFRGLGSHLMTYVRAIEFDKVAEGLVNGITTIFVAVYNFLSELDPTEIGLAIADFINGGFAKLRDNKEQIIGAINSLIHTLSTIFFDALGAVKWGEVFGTIHEYLSGINWKDIFKTAIVGIAAVFTFKSLFKKIAILDIGIQLIAGIIEGIGEAVKNIGSILKQVLVDPFVKWVKDLFGIHSPSTVFAEIGGFLVEGLILGITNFWAKCQECVSKWAQNVKDWFFGVGTTLKDSFAEFGSSIVEGFRERVGSTYETVRGHMDSWAQGVKDWFNGSGGVNDRTWGQYASDIISSFREKIGSTYSTVKSNVSSWAQGVKDWFNGSGGVNTKTWGTYAEEIISGFKSRVGSVYITTKANISTWAEGLKDWFNKSGGVNDKTWGTYASDVISGFKDKIGSTYTTVRGNVETWAKGVKEWFSNIASEKSFSTVAQNVVHGFRDGIGRFYNDCRSAIEGWANSVAGWFMNKLDIHSPSRLFALFGDYTVLGFNNAIEKTGQSTKRVMSDWVDSFTGKGFEIGTRMKFDDSAFKKYQNNYGSDFTNEAIIQRVQKEVTTKGTVQAALSMNGGFSETLRNIVREELTPMISQIVDNTERQANKSEQVIIGGRTLTDAVTRQQKANGFQFVK